MTITVFDWPFVPIFPSLARRPRRNWRSIANESVRTRTPTQVASHAQKYFLRLGLPRDKKEKRRASIHDMTTESEVDAYSERLQLSAGGGAGCGGAFRGPPRKMTKLAPGPLLQRCR